MTLPEFNPDEAERRKRKGMDDAAQARADLLELARTVAVRIAERQPDRLCTADDVQLHLISLGFEPDELGNAAGSIFRGARWQFVEFIRSARTTNHRRIIRVWRLK